MLTFQGASWARNMLALSDMRATHMTIVPPGNMMCIHMSTDKAYLAQLNVVMCITMRVDVGLIFLIC